jgi:PAS domain S-box-containing protein
VTCHPYRPSPAAEVSHVLVITRDVTDTVIAQRVTKASESLLKKGILVPITLFNQDKELKFTLVHNPAPFINSNNILGKTDFEAYPSNEAKALALLKRRVLDSGKPLQERIKLNISGKERTFEVSFEPLNDLQGDIVGITGCAADVTALKDTGRDSYASEDKFSALVDNLKSAVAVYEAVNDGEDFIVRGFNRRAEEIEKAKKAEVLGKSINVVFPYVKNFGLFDVLHKVWKTGEPQSHPATFYKDNRISGWRENYVFKLPTGEVIAVYNDVSRELTAADDLKNSEEKYKSLVENSNDPIFVVDYTGKFTFLNRMAAAYFNGVPEDFIGKTMHDMFSKEYADRHMDSVRKCITSGKVILVENPTSIMGKEFWFSTSLQPVRDNTGKIYMAQVVSRNITELKVTQDSLLLSESRVRSIINNLPDIAWLKDKESRFLIVNEALAAFFGFKTPAELVGKTDLDITPSKELAEHYQQDDNEVMKTGEKKRIVEQLIAKNGKTQWIETIKGPVHNDKGEVIGTAGIARDITQHREMDEKLRISEAKYRKIFEESSEAIFFANGEGKFIELNKAALAMFRVKSLEDTKDMSTKDIYWNEADRQPMLDKLVNEGYVKDHRLDLKRRDGSRFTALVNVTAVKDSEGRILFTSGSARDITGLKPG